MNDGSLSTVERALQLARDGSCRSVAEVRQALKQERYPGISESTSGRSIQEQIRAAIAESRP